jgi:imidazole glycerol phosphate synthase glutamine amidotransferase subunit
VSVTLIDHGTGNVASVERALARIGVASLRASTPEAISSASVLLLPGVGHFSALIRAVDEKLLRQPLLEAIGRGIPFLGICLGLQALCASSDEAPNLSGLGVLPGRVSALPSNVKLPHMGWNTIRSVTASRIMRNVPAESYFYFAHSFAAPPVTGATTATCTHGVDFAAVIEQGNVFATQFHPEKSGEAGAQLLRNFVSLAA